MRNARPLYGDLAYSTRLPAAPSPARGAFSCSVAAPSPLIETCITYRHSRVSGNPAPCGRPGAEFPLSLQGERTPRTRRGEGAAVGRRNAPPPPSFPPLPSFLRRQESIQRHSAMTGRSPVSIDLPGPRHSRESGNLLEARPVRESGNLLEARPVRESRNLPSPPCPNYDTCPYRHPP